MKKTLFIRASKNHHWEEDFDESYQYKITVSGDSSNSSYSWVVGTTEVEFETPSVDHVVACQVSGLENTIAALSADYYKAKENLEEQLKELKCITHQPAPSRTPPTPDAYVPEELVEDDIPF